MRACILDLDLPRCRSSAADDQAKSAQAYELISAPREISTIFGVFQAMPHSSTGFVEVINNKQVGSGARLNGRLQPRQG
jgi:hypothetical protein